MAVEVEEAVARLASLSDALVCEAELLLVEESVEESAEDEVCECECECECKLGSLVAVAEADTEEAVRLAVEAASVLVLE